MLTQLLVLALVASTASAAPSYISPPNPSPAECGDFFTLPNRDITFKFDDGFKDIVATGDDKLDAKACWEYARNTDHHGAVVNRNGGGPTGTFRCFAKSFNRYPAFKGRTYFFSDYKWNDGHVTTSSETAGLYDVTGYDVETGKWEGRYGAPDASRWKHCDLVTVVDGTVYCKVLDKNPNTVVVLGSYCL